MKVNLEGAEIIGEGNFAKIYRFFSKEHKCYLVARVVTINIEELEELKKEMEINRDLMKLTSPYILKIYGIEQNETNILYITEYCQGGSLFQCLDSLANHLLQIQPALSLVVKIAKGIQVLHNNKITHRDLKPQNILLVRKYKPGHQVPQVKIADFGLSTNNIIMKTLAGTKEYIAPQQAKYQNYTNAVDVWALGIILDQMIHGNPFFTGEGNEEVFKRVTTEEYKIRNQTLPQGLQDLLIQMLKKKAFQRPTIGEVINKLQNLLSMTRNVKTTSIGLKSIRGLDKSTAFVCKQHNSRVQYIGEGQPLCGQCVEQDTVSLEAYLKSLSDQKNQLFQAQSLPDLGFKWNLEKQMESTGEYNKLFKQLKSCYQSVNSSSLEQSQLRQLEAAKASSSKWSGELDSKYNSLVGDIQNEFFKQLDSRIQNYVNIYLT